MKQKINIMKHKPDLSDEEIRSYMDFDKLLDARNHATPFISRSKLFTAFAVLVVASAVWWYFEISKPIVTNKVHHESQASTPLNEPIVQADSAISSKPHPRQDAPPESGALRSRTLNKSGQIKAEATDTVSVVSKGDHSTKSVADSYVEAEPKSGYPKFYEYLNNSLRYPVENIKDSIRGVESVSFTINAQGKTENIRVRQSLGKAFDEESIRVIEQMPEWKPAFLNGKPVASQISIPLTFHLERVK